LFPTAWKLGLAASQAEPMANDFEFLVERALRHGVRVDMTTNGTLLTVDRYREARAVLDHVDISIDTVVPKTYAAIRLGAEFSQVHDNVMAIQEERRRTPDDVLLSLSAVVMKSNLYELPALVDFAKRVRADALVFQVLNHDAKSTPEEEPELLGEGCTRTVLEACRDAAKRQGVNLVYLTRRSTRSSPRSPTFAELRPTFRTSACADQQPLSARS
jgi:MoaA/NifB/PqqE/SkfB family radical SAM enzyme